MKPSATANAIQSVSPGIIRKNTIWITATPANTARAPCRSSSMPTATWANEAIAKTMNASQPTIVAVGAMPPRRSSKTFGSVNVVPWKMMLETAVVNRMIVEMRISIARHSALVVPAPADALGLATDAVAALRVARRSR